VEVQGDADVEGLLLRERQHPLQKVESVAELNWEGSVEFDPVGPLIAVLGPEGQWTRLALKSSEDPLDLLSDLLRGTEVETLSGGVLDAPYEAVLEAISS